MLRTIHGQRLFWRQCWRLWPYSLMWRKTWNTRLGKTCPLWMLLGAIHVGNNLWIQLTGRAQWRQRLISEPSVTWSGSSVTNLTRILYGNLAVVLDKRVTSKNVWVEFWMETLKSDVMCGHNSNRITNLSIPFSGLLQLLMRTLHTDPKFSKHDTQVLSVRCKFMFGMKTKIVTTKNQINISRRSLQPYCIKVGKNLRHNLNVQRRNRTCKSRRSIASTDTFLPLTVISVTSYIAVSYTSVPLRVDISMVVFDTWRALSFFF